MRLKSVRGSSISELNARSGAFIAACGYEHRSAALSRVVTGPEQKTAFCFREWSEALSRKDNEKELRGQGFDLQTVGGNDSQRVQNLVGSVAMRAFSSGKAIAFDISAMTRAWHGAIIREIRTIEYASEVEVFFAYVPAKFNPPPHRSLPNEFVAPVDGFASLSTPDLPVAAVIGLGYERERALGLEQLLDPERTMLLVPKTENNDLFYPEVLKSNKNILIKTPSDWIFNYSLAEPAATFAMLASIVSGLRESYRVVLASLGPKMFGLFCFLLATKFNDVSVWRVSSGIHGHPRPVYEDMDRVTVVSTVWEPFGA